MLSQATSRELEVEQPGHEPAPIWDTSTTGGGFTHYAKVLAPYLVLKGVKS